MFSPEPETQTVWFLNGGMNFETGSFSWKCPRSYSVISATEVIGLVIE